MKTDEPQSLEARLDVVDEESSALRRQIKELMETDEARAIEAKLDDLDKESSALRQEDIALRQEIKELEAREGRRDEYLERLAELNKEFSFHRIMLGIFVPIIDTKSVQSGLGGFIVSVVSFISYRLNHGPNAFIATVGAFSVSMILFSVRQSNRLYYGLLEILLSFALIYSVFRNVSTANEEMVAFFSSVYLLVRGFDNFSQGYQQRFDALLAERRGRVKELRRLIRSGSRWESIS